MKLTEEQRKEKEVQDEMKRCVHFKGIQHKHCAAGVDTRELVGGDDFGWALRIPCLSGKGSVICELITLLSREEALAEMEKHEASFQKTMKAVGAVHAHATKAGLGKGHGGRGTMLCPLECGGNINYTVAGVNGHIHAACQNRCVSWME